MNCKRHTFTALLCVCFTAQSILNAQTVMSAASTVNTQKLIFHPTEVNTIYLVTRSNGLLVSKDDGLSWMKIGNGPDTTVDYIENGAWLHGAEERIILEANTKTRNKFFLYYPRNNTWIETPTPATFTPQWDVRTSISLPGICFISGDEGLWRFDVNSGVWENIIPAGQSSATICLPSPANPATYWAGTYYVENSRLRGQVWKSTDAGTSWELKLPWTSGYIQTVDIDPLNENHLFVHAQKIHETNDGGNTWPGVYYLDTLIQRIKSFAIDWNSDTWYATAVADSFYISTNHGISWQGYPFPYFGSPESPVYIDPNNPLRIIVLQPPGIIISTDGGKTWVRNPLELVPLGRETIPAVRTFSVSPPYPQPAWTGGAVTFTARGTNRETLHLTVSNALGQVVLRRNFAATPGGETTATIPLNALSPGVYLCSFSSGAMKATRMLIVQ